MKVNTNPHPNLLPKYAFYMTITIKNTSGKNTSETYVMKPQQCI